MAAVGEAEGMGGLVWPSCPRAQRAQHCTLELGEAAFSSVASAFWPIAEFTEPSRKHCLGPHTKKTQDAVEKRMSLESVFQPDSVAADGPWARCKVRVR